MSSKVIELKLPENQFKDILHAAKGKLASYIMRLVEKENERLERKRLRKEWDDNAPVYSIEDLNKMAEEARKAEYVSMKRVIDENLDIGELARQGIGVSCETKEETHAYLARIKPASSLN